jgi:hypothetical protein
MGFAWLVALVFFVAVTTHAQNDNPREFWTARNTQLGRMIGANLLPTQVKNPEEIDKYLKCHLTTDVSRRDYRDYQTNYGELTRRASQTFDMPRSLSTCLMFRESTFKDGSEVRSSQGALGIHQMMPNTYNEIRASIIETQQDVLQKKQYDELVSRRININQITPEQNVANHGENDFIRCHQFSQKSGPYYDQASTEEKRKSHTECRDSFLKIEYRTQLLNNYGMFLNYAKNGSRHDSQLSTPPLRAQESSPSFVIPPENINEGIRDPKMVIAMQMFYLKEMMLRMDYRLNSRQAVGGDPVGYLVLLAGGYNAGHNALLDSMAKGSSVQDWCRSLAQKGGEETRNYMLSVRRCLSKNDYKGPTGQDSRCENNLMPRMDDPCVTSRPPARPAGLGQTPVEEAPSGLETSPRPRARPTNIEQ